MKNLFRYILFLKKIKQRKSYEFKKSYEAATVGIL